MRLAAQATGLTMARPAAADDAPRRHDDGWSRGRSLKGFSRMSCKYSECIAGRCIVDISPCRRSNGRLWRHREAKLCEAYTSRQAFSPWKSLACIFLSTTRSARKNDATVAAAGGEHRAAPRRGAHSARKTHENMSVRMQANCSPMPLRCRIDPLVHAHIAGHATRAPMKIRNTCDAGSCTAHRMFATRDRFSGPVPHRADADRCARAAHPPARRSPRWPHRPPAPCPAPACSRG